MDIDLEYDILFNQEQKKKKYDKNNSNARTKKTIAEQGDELLYLAQNKLVDEYSLNSVLSGTERCHELIENQNDNIEFTLDDNVDSSLNENYPMIFSDTQQASDNNYDEKSDFDSDEFIDDSSCDNDYEYLFTENPQSVHQFTSTSTNSYCIELLKLLRDANVSKSHSKRFISLIKSILPIPNNFPSKFEDILPLLNVQDLFIKRSVCLICKTDLPFKEKNAQNVMLLMKR
jgi:hypothetical protein